MGVSGTASEARAAWAMLWMERLSGVATMTRCTARLCVREFGGLLGLQIAAEEAGDGHLR